MTNEQALAAVDALDAYLNAREEEQLFKGTLPADALAEKTQATRKRLVEALETGAAA